MQAPLVVFGPQSPSYQKGEYPIRFPPRRPWGHIEALPSLCSPPPRSHRGAETRRARGPSVRGWGLLLGDRLNFCLQNSSQWDPKAYHSIKQWVVGRAYGLRVGPTDPYALQKERKREREL